MTTYATPNVLEDFEAFSFLRGRLMALAAILNDNTEEVVLETLVELLAVAGIDGFFTSARYAEVVAID